MDLFLYRWLPLLKWGLPAGLALNAALVFAQDSSEVPPPKLQYRSVLSQYQAFNEQPVAPWRETNETVEKIGGWRVYAKEARQAVPADKAPATPAKAEINAEHGRKP